MKKSRQWHIDNKFSVFNKTEGLCKHCNKKCLLREGCVHHTTYKNINGVSIYDLDIETLLNNNIIIWLCNICHRNLHELESIDGITKIRGLCVVCGNSKGLFERGKLIGETEKLCKQCFREVRDKRLDILNKQLNLF